MRAGVCRHRLGMGRDLCAALEKPRNILSQLRKVYWQWRPQTFLPRIWDLRLAARWLRPEKHPVSALREISIP